MRNDPLLEPFQLKHLKLRNRIMATSHEPAYAEDGMPKERYRAYHVERAKGGVALTMTAGSAAVSLDSPPVFNNILAFKDDPDRFVLQGVHMMLDGDHQRPWKADEPRQSRLVFIGRNLPEAVIREGFEKCLV